MNREDVKNADEDHRVRVARQRRSRTRTRLLEAVLATCAARLNQDLPTVDDVIAEADVSRATFYKYFNSVEEAIRVYGHMLMEEMFRSLVTLFTPQDDELSRIVTAIQLFLMRSVIDPQWGAFLSRTAHLARETILVDRIVDYVETARGKGVLNVQAPLPASSMIIGTVLEAVRHISRTNLRSRTYVDGITAMLLHGLGVEQAVAEDLIRSRTIYIRGLAPDRLSWWSDPWARMPEDRSETRNS
ncbi:TetR/AcrR family transcriptional regulator [Novosphingobium terrae]|uniref:TetR/AcrR family transcriptional regulator n=1 Tax=Novosphingobium terrae TaxID=2726189 RepID=UPI00197FA621|nr:TetR/AcrR family transcriptional regulator [Novosphingobium terrae]